MENIQIDMREGQAGGSWREVQLKSIAAGQSTKVHWRRSQSNAPLLDGIVESGAINHDWQWHYAHAVPSADAEVSFEVPPGLTIGLLYEGELQLELGGQAYRLRAPTPVAFCFGNTEPLTISRRFKAGRVVYKCTLGLSKAWLNAMELAHFSQTRPLLSFDAEPSVIQAMNSIAGRGGEHYSCGAQRKLEQMSCVNHLLSAAASAMRVQGLVAPKPQMIKGAATLEQRLLARVREIIQRDNILLEDIQVDAIAKHLSTSTSGIQRVAKKCFGQSLLQYIRLAKLANAHRAIRERRLSIGEAAFLAGYKHPSNFALAFKRAYGVTPGEAAVLSSAGA